MGKLYVKSESQVHILSEQIHKITCVSLDLADISYNQTLEDNYNALFKVDRDKIISLRT